MEGKEEGVKVRREKRKVCKRKERERERKGSGEFRGAERRRRGWRERLVEWRRRSGEVEERVRREDGEVGRKVEGATWGETVAQGEIMPAVVSKLTPIGASSLTCGDVRELGFQLALCYQYSTS